jgi:Ca2+-binding EF-hand superfamily protein
MKCWIATLLAGGALSVASAQAGTAVADAEKAPDFLALDADRDGFISRSEADSVPELKKIFASVDVDRDGQLNTSEWSGAVARLRGLG